MARKKDTTGDATGDGTRGPVIAGLSYEAALSELQALVDSIEGGEVGLEQSLEAYRRGETLLAHCRALLDKADQTVRTLSLSEFERDAATAEGRPSDGQDD
jgi:exodeoxyribonuclease VII small subunit